MRFQLNFVHAGFMVMMAVCSAAFAQGIADNYPSKPIMMVIPFASGGNTDVEARRYSAKLSQFLGDRPVLVDYKVGAGGTIGAAYAAKQPPDGYTIFVVSGAFTVAPSLYQNLPFDVSKDFAPLSQISSRVTMFTANPSTPYKNVQEFIAYARANPGKVNMATAGAGGETHLAGAWLSSLTNTKVTLVHYKASPNLYLDLQAGRVDVTLNLLPPGLPLVKAGKLKVLGIGNAQRTQILPDVPTVAEQGVSGYDYTSWLGMVTTAGTPAPIINKLAVELAKVAKSPDVIEAMAQSATVMVGSTPEQFRQLLNVEVARWRKVIQDNDIKLEQ